MGNRNLQDLLPSSISPDPKIQGFARAWQGLAGPLENDTIPVELIYPVIDSLSDDLLAVIAWGFHIEGYDLLESRVERLHLVKSFFTYHRFKGTKFGLALYFQTFLKRDLLAASPPTKSYCGSSLTDAERAAWAANFPELRVYPFRHAGVRQGAFIGDFLIQFFPNTSDALLRIGEQVTLYDPIESAETKLDSLVTDRDVAAGNATRTVTAHLPGKAGRAMFVGRVVGPFFTTDTGASGRVYTLAMTVGYEDEIARRHALSVRPSLTPVSIGCETVASPGSRGYGLFLGHRWPGAYDQRAATFLEGRFPVQSSARDRLYRMTKLFDPARAAFNRRESSAFLGAFKIGALRPHYAEAAVDMVRTAPARAAFCGRLWPSVTFCCDLDARSWIDRMRRVGKMAVRLSDRVLVSTNNRRQIQASESLTCGSATCGEFQLEAF